MDYYSRLTWIEVYQKFFEAYANFRAEGTAKHWIEHNDRKIELAFFDCGDFIQVEMYCPNIIRSLCGKYDGLAQNTEELIRMILWLTLDVEELDVYNIKASDSEEEYKELRDILVERYRKCYEDTNKEDWKDAGEESFIIELHGRRIHVYFYPCAIWDLYEYVNILLYCLDTGINCSTGIEQEKDNPEKLIRMIQDMSLEPEIIEFNITDSIREHDLIRKALIGRQTENGIDRVRHPFSNPHLIWNGDVFVDRYLILHNRNIKVQYEVKEGYVDIIISCLTTGKSCSLVLYKHSNSKEIDDVCEEMVYKIQELAWEVV